MKTEKTKRRGRIRKRPKKEKKTGYVGTKGGGDGLGGDGKLGRGIIS